MDPTDMSKTFRTRTPKGFDPPRERALCTSQRGAPSVLLSRSARSDRLALPLGPGRGRRPQAVLPWRIRPAEVLAKAYRRDPRGC